MWLSHAAQLSLVRGAASGQTDVRRGGQRQTDALGVAVAQGQSAQVDDLRPGRFLPSATGAFEAHLEEALAG